MKNQRDKVGSLSDIAQMALHMHIIMDYILCFTFLLILHETL